MSQHRPIRRQVARVVLLDPRNRVLLLRAQDPVHPDQPAFWYLPGGGMHAGETPAEAARRELREETAIEDVEIGPVVSRLAEVRFQFGGQSFEQDEWHLLARVADDLVGESVAGDAEAPAVAAHRWWSIDDLVRSKEAIYPRALVTVVERLLRSGAPDTPWHLTDV